MGINPDKLNGKKIGLALSGGAARGLAHIGVVEVLQKEGIPIDMVAGTSAGAIVGAAYAWNRNITPLRRYAMLRRNWMKIAPLLDISLFKSGFIKGSKLHKLMLSYFGEDITFDKLQIPFACVATDIDTGEEIIIDSGSVAEAMRASISIPGIFSAVKHEKRYLVDGGLTTPIPINVVRNMGADFVIAVNVTPGMTDRVRKSRKEPNVFQVILQSIYIATYSLARNSLKDADIVIEPELSSLGTGDFQKSREFISLGKEAARQAIPEITKKLNKLLED